MTTKTRRTIHALRCHCPLRRSSKCLWHLQWREWGGKGDSQGQWAFRAGFVELPLVCVLKKDQTPAQSVGARQNGWGLPVHRGEEEMETDKQTHRQTSILRGKGEERGKERE